VAIIQINKNLMFDKRRRHLSVVINIKHAPTCHRLTEGL